MRFLFCLLIALMLNSCVQAQEKPAQTTDFAIEDIGNGIYVHHGKHLDIDEGYQGDICNISFVVGSLGVAVIDTGGSLKTGNKLHDAIKKVTDKPILYVINTHVHPDHIFGNAAFVQDKAQFVGHEKLAVAMQLRKEAYDKLNLKYMGDDANHNGAFFLMDNFGFMNYYGKERKGPVADYGSQVFDYKTVTRCPVYITWADRRRKHNNLYLLVNGIG